MKLFSSFCKFICKPFTLCRNKIAIDETAHTKPIETEPELKLGDIYSNNFNYRINL
jgi:hypothetical protein